MTTGEKIAEGRRKLGLTQEELAERCGVTRQSVSRWESDGAYPETEKLICLAELFGVSMDYLLGVSEREKGEAGETEKSDGAREEKGAQEEDRGRDHFGRMQMSFSFPEYVSEKQVWGMPLLCISKHAKGFFAIGITAKGVFSMGILSRGVVSFGLLSLGVLAWGMLALGILSFGGISVGLVAFGGVALGVVSFGGLSVGVYSVGGCAIGLFSCGGYANGYYLAYGGYARGMVAVSSSRAMGSVYAYVGEHPERVMEEIVAAANVVPAWLNPFKNLWLMLI